MPMSNPLALLGKLAQIASTLPPEALSLILDVVKSAASSDDPVRTARLAALAAASKTATEAAIEADLARNKR
jgi:hypothetical protein